MKRVFYILTIIIMVFAIFSCEDYTEDYSVPTASIQADFTYTSSTSFDPPDNIQFTNQSVVPESRGSVSYAWDFGDGTTSNEQSPAHTFESEGKYTITLTLTPSSESLHYDKLVATTNIELANPKDTIFKEDFEKSPLIPSNWVLANLDGNTPDNENYATMKDSAWIVMYSGTFEGNVALGISFYNPEAGADDWMITPKISLGSSSVLTWQAMSFTTSGDYPDSYQIYVSTTTQDVNGCKGNGVIYRVIDESPSEDAGGDGVQTHTVDLSQFANKDVYIGFRLMTPSPGGDRLAIDNIAVVNQ